MRGLKPLDIEKKNATNQDAQWGWRLRVTEVEVTAITRLPINITEHVYFCLRSCNKYALHMSVFLNELRFLSLHQIIFHLFINENLKTRNYFHSKLSLNSCKSSPNKRGNVCKRLVIINRELCLTDYLCWLDVFYRIGFMNINYGARETDTKKMKSNDLALGGFECF